jgi:cobalt/nickel transport system permease protein
VFIDRLELNGRSPPVSLLRRLDPRCRIVTAVALITLAVQLEASVSLIALILICLVFLVSALRVVLLRLLPVNVFTLALWLSLPLGARFGGLSPAAALLYTLRINAAALLYMALVIPLGIGGLSNALSSLHIPPKLISLLLLTHRFIFVMYERVFSSALSLRIRKPRGMTAPTLWRSYAGLLSSSLIGADIRSRKVWTALVSRGFDGAFPVTEEFRWRARDTVALLSCAIVVISALSLDRLLV